MSIILYIDTMSKEHVVWLQANAVLWYLDNYVEYKALKTITSSYVLYVDDLTRHYSKCYKSFNQLYFDFQELVRTRIPEPVQGALDGLSTPVSS